MATSPPPGVMVRSPVEVRMSPERFRVPAISFEVPFMSILPPVVKLPLISRCPGPSEAVVLPSATDPDIVAYPFEKSV